MWSFSDLDQVFRRRVNGTGRVRISNHVVCFPLSSISACSVHKPVGFLRVSHREFAPLYSRSNRNGITAGRFLLFTVNSGNLRVAVLIGNIKFKSPFLHLSRVGLKINLTCQYYGHVSEKQVCLTSISRRMISRNEIPHPLVAPTVDSIKYPAPLISALENR